jgi:hypothetical protein
MPGHDGPRTDFGAGYPALRAGQGRLPAPEDVFLAWLLGLPNDADVALAAHHEIARLDAAAPLPAGPKRLRELFFAAVEASFGGGIIGGASALSRSV